MPIKPPSHHVDKDVFAEARPVAHHELTRLHNGLWVAGVHAKDWHVERLDSVACLLKTAIVFSFRRETQLVVCDDVDGAAYVKFGKFAHCKSLIGAALPCESRVAVTLDVHDACLWLALVL